MQVFRTLNDKIHKEYGLDKCAKDCTQGRKISSLTKFNT